ncbi:hypothetical protein GOP47_0010053 [Adiantum capillus-veneris]|uniref:Uncharacterized protein n=1 Tax=Adiantum capillus-veneris TaxID=13818 RepID=A0A9D4ZHE6_ADICA|nr:hypothetical protein GOP47_0030761 [Adiantum capillus-veneris]KAI5074092.1 hypothetical protein GOP47_0010053 [Adiantum capillus-veneris]
MAYHSFGTVIDMNQETVRKIYKEDLSTKVFLYSLGEVSAKAMETTPPPLSQTLLLLQNPKSPTTVNNLLKEKLEGERPLQSSFAQNLISHENRMTNIEKKSKDLQEKNRDLEEKFNSIYESLNWMGGDRF